MHYFPREISKIDFFILILIRGLVYTTSFPSSPVLILITFSTG